MGPSWLLGCVSWVMTRSPITTHYLKSGGYGIGEPDADFYQSFLADPIFRLAPGRWKLTAYAPLTIGPEGCRGTRVDLKASITLIVQ